MKSRKDHECLPRPVQFFNTTLYQCLCGKYFQKEDYEALLDKESGLSELQDKTDKQE